MFNIYNDDYIFIKFFSKKLCIFLIYWILKKNIPFLLHIFLIYFISVGKTLPSVIFSATAATTL